jgi:predicted Zn-dependent protease
MANAFVLPGNHIFVMTGLFQYVRDEDELAAVLSHEIAVSP